MFFDMFKIYHKYKRLKIFQLLAPFSYYRYDILI